VRIGGPARKHGVTDADIWHTARTAVRRVVMDEHLTMLIGPAADGALLEVGVLDLDGDDPVIIHAIADPNEVLPIPGMREVSTMRHTDDDIEQAALRFERMADELDPTTAEVDHTDDLRQIATVSEALRTDEAQLRETIEIARAHGRSWNQIALALGVSRQAARQRFTDKAHA